MTEKTAPKPRKRRAVSIASGAHVPHIDLDALFQARHGADTMASAAAAPLEGAAMTGGGIQTASATAHVAAHELPLPPPTGTARWKRPRNPITGA